MLTRRTMLRRLGAGLPMLLCGLPAGAPVSTFKVEDSGFSKEDAAFLEELERATFCYFTECAHPGTGLAKDRNHVTGEDKREIASIAATGVGLTA